MPDIKAVAFDMDGLMFNTEDLYDLVADATLEPFGKEFNDEVKLLMMGLHAEDAIDTMIDYYKLDATRDEMLDRTDQLISTIFPEKIEMMPGLVELLDHLEQLGLPKCLTTSSRLKNVAYGFDKFNFHDRFEFKITAETTTNAKPDPEIYLTAASKFGINSEELLVLEDSPKGSLAGARSGAFTVAVPTVHTENEDYSHVSLVIDSLADKRLMSLLKPVS